MQAKSRNYQSGLKTETRFNYMLSTWDTLASKIQIEWREKDENIYTMQATAIIELGKLS